MKFTCDTVVKTCTDREKQITVGNCHICCICAVHSEVSNKKRMLRRDSTAAHDCSYDRNLSFFNYRSKNLICICNIDTATCQEQRLFCLLKHLQGFFELAHMYACIWFVTTDVHSFWILGTAKFCHNIFWKIDKDRTRTTGSCNIKSFFDNATEIFTITNRNTIFGNASCDTNDIYFLECIISDQMSCNLSGETYKGNTVIVCSSQSGNKVGSSGTAGNKADTNFTGCSCISISFMHQSLFVSWQDDIDPTLSV